MGNNDDFLNRRNEVLGHLKAQLDNLFANGYDLALVGFEINAEHKDRGDFNIELAFNWNERLRTPEGPWLELNEAYPSGVDETARTVFKGVLHGYTKDIEVHGSYKDMI